MLESFKNKLPDIASQRTHLSQAGALDSVGMSGIEMPIRLPSEAGEVMRTPAKVDASVSLDDTGARGIHMSRLFSATQEILSTQNLSFAVLERILESFLQSHEGLSSKAEIAVHFQAMISQASLKSGLKGWRTYPVTLRAEKKRGEATRFFTETQVIYSSTCPASAALARQLIQENFVNNFAHKDMSFTQIKEWLGTSAGINATPHAQRSFASVTVESEMSFEKLIHLIESILVTVVQTVVKREDEQEFALRNGQNLMFCEDAARRAQLALNALPEVKSYKAEFRHAESLHPHDAVSRISK